MIPVTWQIANSARPVLLGVGEAGRCWRHRAGTPTPVVVADRRYYLGSISGKKVIV